METEKRLKMLQLFYAGVLADSVRRYSEAGILNKVERQKMLEQKMAARNQLAQMNITTPGGIFKTFSDIFGCAKWELVENPGKVSACSQSCLLCAISKKMDIPKPCNIYCINPVMAQIEALDGAYTLSVKSTLWESDRCEFIAESGQ